NVGLYRRRILMEVTAAVLREVGGDFGLEKVRLEAPRPGEVLVQISAVGICRTDLATRDGALPFPLPGVLGHAGAGVVVDVGAGAVMRSFAAPAGSSVLILGAGSVGLSAVLGGVVQGCGHIIVVEPVAARRELAVRLGAAHTIDPAAGAVSEQVRGLSPQGVN